MGGHPSFHSDHHQARLPLGVDLQPTSFVHPKARGRSPRPRRRSLQALTKGGYLSSPSTALLLGKPLHQEGIPVPAYLDDWITQAPNKIVLQINLRKITSTLKNLGFLIYYEKSQLTPASDLTWLGVRWFLQKGLWDVPPSFKEKISSEVNQLLHAKRISRRKWESFMGKLAFLGQIHKHLRPKILSPAKLRDKKVPLPEVFKESLKRRTSPAALPGPTPFLQPQQKIALWTDASLSGWGAHSDEGHFCQGLWTKQEQGLHINTLEVLAVIRAIEALDLGDLHISLHIDN